MMKPTFFKNCMKEMNWVESVEKNRTEDHTYNMQQEFVMYMRWCYKQLQVYVRVARKTFA